MGNFSSIIRSLWLRVALGSSIALIVTLSIVVIAVHQLTLSSERSDLDSTLRREGEAVAQEIVADLSALQMPDSEVSIDLDDIEVIVSRSLARHPGSAIHLSIVRVGDLVLSSARGPSRLTDLRNVGMLPSISPGTMGSFAGIRARSAEIQIGDLVLVVETLGDDSAIVEDARDIALRTLVATTVGGLVGLAGLTFAVHRSTRGLRSVSATVRRTRLENLSVRVPPQQGSGEVAQLGRDVNAMLDELESARSSKDELIASVSHELRTPLAAARGHMDLLKDHRSSDPQATILRVDREIGRITRLVEDLLALSRAGDSAWLSRKIVHVREILSELDERLPVLGAEHVRIENPPDVLIEVDLDRILQALSNLVSNSVLHTPPGTQVRVLVETNSGFLSFVVTDTGPGIPKGVLDRFGQAFVRGSPTGTGLGLAVTRAVVSAHGGRLVVQSDGTGTSVKITLPLDASAEE